MSEKLQSLDVSKKPSRKVIRGVLYAVLYVSGLVVAYAYWFGARISLCGISGCSGGGFGVAYNPESVKAALMWSGIAAAIPPFLIFFISKFKWWWAVITIVTFICIPIIGAMLIGAGADGYPVNRIR